MIIFVLDSGLDSYIINQFWNPINNEHDFFFFKRRIQLDLFSLFKQTNKQTRNETTHKKKINISRPNFMNMQVWLAKTNKQTMSRQNTWVILKWKKITVKHHNKKAIVHEHHNIWIYHYVHFVNTVEKTKQKNKKQWKAVQNNNISREYSLIKCNLIFQIFLWYNEEYIYISLNYGEWR